jgi:hypothetical protein
VALPLEVDAAAPVEPPVAVPDTLPDVGFVSLPPVLPPFAEPVSFWPVLTFPLELSPLLTSPAFAVPDLEVETESPPSPPVLPWSPDELTSLFAVLGPEPPVESVEQPAFWQAPVLLLAFDELSILETDVPPLPPVPPTALPPLEDASPLTALPPCDKSAFWLAICCWMFATEPSLMTLMSGLVYPNAAGATIRKASAVTSPPSHIDLCDKALLLSSFLN